MFPGPNGGRIPHSTAFGHVCLVLQAICLSTLSLLYEMADITGMCFEVVWPLSGASSFYE